MFLFWFLEPEQIQDAHCGACFVWSLESCLIKNLSLRVKIFPNFEKYLLLRCVPPVPVTSAESNRCPGGGELCDSRSSPCIRCCLHSPHTSRHQHWHILTTKRDHGSVCVAEAPRDLTRYILPSRQSQWWAWEKWGLRRTATLLCWR